MWKQFFESAGGLGRQALEDVLEVAIRIVTVEPGGLDEAHNSGGTLTGAQGPGEEPVGSAEGHRPDAVFDVVVVDGVSGGANTVDYGRFKNRDRRRGAA
jgi:hypothetical protein